MTIWSIEDLWHWGEAAAPVGRLLAGLRKYRKITQVELAGRLGMTSVNISRIEHGGDLYVSTFVELSRELRLEPMLVPKEHVSVVRALLDSLASESAASAEPLQRPRFG